MFRSRNRYQSVPRMLQNAVMFVPPAYRGPNIRYDLRKVARPRVRPCDGTAEDSTLCTRGRMHDFWRIALNESGTRRQFLALSGGLTAALSLRGLPALRADRRPRVRAYPFTLGVASGDPMPDGVVLWTRLAPEPMTPGGGMPPEQVAVDWEVAADDGFRNIVQRGSTLAVRELAHSVHVEAAGLEPDRPYWYRFIAGREAKIGRAHV